MAFDTFVFSLKFFSSSTFLATWAQLNPRLAVDTSPWLPQRRSTGFCRVYHTSARDENVWKRLLADFTARSNLPSRQYSYVEGTNARSSGTEGWSQNVKLISANTDAPMVDATLESLHKTTLEKYRRGHPLEFFIAIRPQTKTVNQTMRCALIFDHVT
jgi:hypothetical protein